MTLPNPRLQSQDLILGFMMPQFAAAQPHSIPAVTPSAITTTGFTEANVTVAMNGLLAIPQDGDARGQWRIVHSVASTTTTMNKPWASVTNTTRIALYQLAEVPWRVTTADGSSVFDVISSLHASASGEADAFWAGHGYLAIKMAGANSGKARAVSTFVSSTGTLADAAADATTLGDLFILRKPFVPQADIEASINHRTLPRALIGTGRQDADMSVPITVEGSVTYPLAVRPIQTAGASGIVAGRPVEMSDMLACVFNERRDTGGTITSAGAAVVDSTSSLLTPGGGALFNTGECVHILRTQSAGVDIAEYGAGQLTHASVTASSIMHASTSYVRKTDGWMPYGFDIFRGGLRRQLYYGCMPQVKTTIARDALVLFNWEWMAPECLEWNEARPVSLSGSAPIVLGDAGVPTDGKAAIVKLNGTSFHMVNMEIDWGFRPVMRPSLSGINQYDGCAMDTAPITGSFVMLADMDDRLIALVELLQRGRTVQFLYQKGKAAKETFGIGFVAMQMSRVQFRNGDRQGELECEFVAVDPDAAGFSLATYPGLTAGSFWWC